MEKYLLKKIVLLCTLIVLFFGFTFVQIQAMDCSQKTYTALSIDGGGIRGLIPIKFLSKIEDKTKKPICELFDYIGGTSTGGLLTLGLTVPDPRNKMKPLYNANQLKDIFSSEERYEVFPFSWWNTITSLGSYTRSLYPAASFEKDLEKRFGNCYQTEALTNILVTATEFRTKNMTVFCKEGKDIGAMIMPGKILMRDIARATSAAPSYFVAGKVIEPELGGGYTTNYYVDGGICCNNPAQLVWNRLQREYNATPNNVYLLSLGTGTLDFPYLKVPAEDSGIKGWLPELSGYFMDSNSWSVDDEMKHLLGSNYERIQVMLQKDIDLAAIDKDSIEELEKCADSIIKDEIINEICVRLKRAGKW